MPGRLIHPIRCRPDPAQFGAWAGLAHDQSQIARGVLGIECQGLPVLQPSRMLQAMKQQIAGKIQ